MDLDFEDKIALVTGAASGIGFGLAERLAEQGATVFATDIDATGLERLQSCPHRIEAHEQDVTSEDAWARMMQIIETQAGRLDILVNNAGIGALGNVQDTPPDLWRRVHAVDLDSVYLGCRAAIPLMRGAGGSIVNIASIAGVVAAHNLAAYNSAKAAVIHLTKSVALDCTRKGYAIRCNAVLPAFTDTPILDPMARDGDREALAAKLAAQIPMGRLGTVDDVVNGVLFLASDKAGFITGTELRIDGGLSAT